MPSIEITNRLTVDGISFIDNETVTVDGVQRKEATKAVAKIGQLTTRTDSNTGIITMAGGHGFITGDHIDVYWTESGVNGTRRRMAATVTVNAVAVDLGTGDNLPTNLTAVTAQIPTEEEFLVTGNNVAAIGAKASRRGIIVFAESDGTEILAIDDNLDGTAGGGFQWFDGSGSANPLASADVAKVFFSNGDSSVANSLVALVGAN